MDVAQWVRLCGLKEAPAEGTVIEAEAEGREICLANIDGKLAALDNICPHRQGPLGQGWIEGNSVVCPWHSWTFDCKTGESGYPPNHHVDVVLLRIEGDDVLVDIERQPTTCNPEGSTEFLAAK